MTAPLRPVLMRTLADAMLRISRRGVFCYSSIGAGLASPMWPILSR